MRDPMEDEAADARAGAGAEPRRAPDRGEAVSAAASDALATGLVAASLAYLAALLVLGVPRAALVLENAIDPGLRRRLFVLVAGAAIGGALTACVLHLVSFRLSRRATRGGGWRADLDRDNLRDRLARLRPLALVWLLPFLLDHQVWKARALLLSLVALAALVPFSTWARDARETRLSALELSRTATATLLLLAMAAYAAYVGYYTTLHHQRLGTAAYDLGIFENILWNTTEGRFFASSIMGGSHFGFHTSFIFVPLVPIYALLPRPETLLVVQAVVFALAAWPLYLAARELLGSRSAGLGAALVYLLHPAIEAANFYDFHELAFAPPLFFSAFYFWLKRRRFPFWVAVFLLLTVKEDLSILVALLGVFSFLSRRRAEGAAIAVAGALAYVLLQNVAIPYFGDRPHDYTWYYTDMIPYGEGPSGLIRTLLVSPLFSLAHALTAKKVLYLVQTLAPVAFLCLLGARGITLIGYGLLLALFASREPVFTLGYQYALLLVPPAFAGALVHAAELSPPRRRQALFIAAAMCLLLSWHHGMVYPRRGLVAGYRDVDFTPLTADERVRYEEVQEVARSLDPELSVVASESVVPHLARRQRIMTIRYAEKMGAEHHDRFVLLGQDLDPATRARFPHVFNGRDYVPVHQGRFVVVLARVPPGDPRR